MTTSETHGKFELRSIENGDRLVYEYLPTGETVEVASDGTVSSPAINTERLSNTVGDAAIQTAWDGLVVPVADGVGMDSAIDPSNVSDPLTQAYSVIANNGGAGAILLPPKIITDDGGDITDFDDTKCIGWGVGTTTVEFTNTDVPAFRCVDGATSRYSYWDGVLFNGSSISDREGSANANATSAFHFDTTSSFHPRNVDFGSVGFRNWGDRTIWIDGSHPFDSRWQHLNFGFGGNNGNHIYSEGGGMVDIGYLSGGPADGNSVINIRPSGGTKFTINQLNCGGNAARAVTNSNTGNALLQIHRVNFEASSTNAVEAVNTRTNTYIDIIVINGVTVDQAVNLSFNANGCVFGTIDISGSGTINNSRIVVSNDLTGSITYHGPSDHVSGNVGGAWSEPVVCLADGVYKLSDTAGYQVGEDLLVGQHASTYTLSNVTTDRTLDADATTDAELADVLATLIQDLGLG